MVGYIQKHLIELGEKYGIVSLYDVEAVYPAGDIRREMTKLKVQGYFKEFLDKRGFIKWKFLKKKPKEYAD